MFDKKIVLRLRNRRGDKLDPIKYHADIGRLADALIFHDRALVIIEDPQEMITIVDWLGLPRTIKLVSDHVLSFVFIQAQPQVLLLNGEYRLVRLFAGDHLRDNRPPAFQNKSEFEHYFKVCISRAFLPTGFDLNDEFYSFIRANLFLAADPLPNAILEFSEQVLQDRSSIQKVLLKAATDFARPTSLLNGLSYDTGRFEFDYEDSNTLADIVALYEMILDLAYSAAMGCNEYLSSECGSLLFESLSLGTIDEPIQAEYGNRVLEIARVPRVAHAVYAEGLDAETVISLRESKDAVRFRTWLRDSSDDSRKAVEEVVAEYMTAVTKAVGKENLILEGMKFAAPFAADSLVPGLGSAAASLDWLRQRVKAARSWNPSRFIDGTLKRSLAQINWSESRPTVPIDLDFLFQHGLEVSSMEVYGDSSVSIKLQKAENEVFNFKIVKGTKQMSSLMNYEAGLIRASTGIWLFHCRNCEARNRVIPGRLSDAICGRCKAHIDIPWRSI